MLKLVLILGILDQNHCQQQGQQQPHLKDQGIVSENIFRPRLFLDFVHIEEFDFVQVKEFTANFGPCLLHRINQLMAAGGILGQGYTQLDISLCSNEMLQMHFRFKRKRKDCRA